MNVKIEKSWKDALSEEFGKPYFAQLVDFVHREYASGICYPPGNLVFNAFNLCPFYDVKVVIIGQDPYHEPGQAQGLSFSVADGVKFPPSLENIFKEVQADTGNPIPEGGTGRVVAECDIDRKGAFGRISPGKRLGGIYRCGNTRTCHKTDRNSLYAVGRICTAKRNAHRPEQ